MTAHVGGLPVEELVPAIAGAGTGLLALRAWLTARVRPRRRAGA